MAYSTQVVTWQGNVRRIALVAFVSAAVYHATAACFAGLGAAGNPWRHATFVLINGAGVWGLATRSPYLLPALLVVTVQQYYSHGSRALRWWTTQGRVDWVSLGVLVLLPALLLAVATERCDGRRLPIVEKSDRLG